MFKFIKNVALALLLTVAAAVAHTVYAQGTVVYTNNPVIVKGMKYQGTYAGGTTYALNDVVISGGVEYVSLVYPNMGNTPASNPLSWASLASGSVMLTPSGNQTVAQPSGTTLSVSSLDTVINPTVAPYNTGADIGAWINAAITALPALGGEIFIPAGTYNFVTPIAVSKNNVAIVGTSSDSVVLQYTPAGGTAISVTGSSVRLSSFTISGISGVTTNVALLVSSPYDSFDHLVIGGQATTKFHEGILFGNNAFLDYFYKIRDEFNDQNMYFPAGLTNAGENISFVASGFSGGGSAVFAGCLRNGDPGVSGGAEMEFINTSFDQCQIVNNEGLLKIYGSHFEDGGIGSDYPFLKVFSSGLDSITGDVGVFLNASTVQINTTPTGTALFEADKFGQLHIEGMFINATPAIPVVQLGSTSSDSPFLEYKDISNQLTEAQLVSVFSGASPTLEITTAGVSDHTSLASHVFIQNPAYGRDYAVVTRGSMIGMYQWSGSGNLWQGLQIKPYNFNHGFQVCGTGATINFTGYSTLGSETCTGGTIVTDTAITLPGAPSGSFVRADGGGYGTAGLLYNASGTLQTSAHTVRGTSGAMSGGSVTVTFSGAAVFTSSSTYTCTANETVSGIIYQPIGVTYTSGTSVTFSNDSSDTATVSFICTGN